MESVLRYELDDYGKIGITLARFNSLQELDKFLTAFNDSNDVKEQYLDKINTFLQSKEAIEFLRNYKEKENNGFVRGYCKDQYRPRPVPLLYKSTLLSEKEIFHLLPDKLNKKEVLKDLYEHKFFLLKTQFLKDELHRHLNGGTNRVFIREFIKYLHSSNENERYFAFRVMCDKCGLLKEPRKKTENVHKIRLNDVRCIAKGYHLEKVKFYSFGDYSDDELYEMQKDNQESKLSLCDDADEYFASIFRMVKGDISKLLEFFDLEEINRNTNYSEYMKIKKRGK